MLLHGESLSLFGGSAGLRDEGLLDSALARPENQQRYAAQPDLAALAGAYGYGLAQNHPFVDGNKRAALLAIALFLHVNGHSFHPDKVDAVRVIFGLAAGQVGEHALADWIRSNMTVQG